MVGIFSKFSSSKSGHRRTQSAIDAREVSAPIPEDTVAEVAQPVAHGIDVGVEFKPVEHPVEPLDNDKPVQCPLPEPSILNDGRIWKERVSAAHVRRRSDLPLRAEGSAGDSEAAAGSNSRPARQNRMMLPSISAPEHNLVNLLEECKASGIL
ncbi:uncharacterized protein LOC110692816 isoform X1 [Chenopodium quinoa]|uniref:Cystic fibrosis transmembrane conductance regulator n=1 Tax=Chenopodium quinoa TaxID=63459 RepID=A0A803MCY0_CHEQI|nr:uncharacterized protein LOC110692816 isoform X1 [Chenopodium quinoa]